MSNINFSNTTPAPAAGHTNVAFAVGGSNDISASIATPLVAANNLSDVPTPATGLSNLGGASLSAANTFTGSNTFTGTNIFIAGAISGAFGGWQSWTPTFTPLSPMTITPGTLSINDAQYLQVGPWVFVLLQATYTLAGTASGQIKISYPVPPVGYASLLNAVIASGASYSAALCTIYLGNGFINLQPLAASPFTLGANTVYISGFYRSA